MIDGELVGTLAWCLDTRQETHVDMRLTRSTGRANGFPLIFCEDTQPNTGVFFLVGRSDLRLVSLVRVKVRVLSPLFRMSGRRS